MIAYKNEVDMLNKKTIKYHGNWHGARVSIMSFALVLFWYSSNSVDNNVYTNIGSLEQYAVDTNTPLPSSSSSSSSCDKMESVNIWPLPLNFSMGSTSRRMDRMMKMTGKDASIPTLQRAWSRYSTLIFTHEENTNLLFSKKQHHDDERNSNCGWKYVRSCSAT